MPIWVANVMPSYNKLNEYNTSHFTTCCYLQGHAIVVSSARSGAYRHRVKNATNRPKIGRQRQALEKGANSEVCQLCRRLKTYRKTGNKGKQSRDIDFVTQIFQHLETLLEFPTQFNPWATISAGTQSLQATGNLWVSTNSR